MTDFCKYGVVLLLPLILGASACPQQVAPTGAPSGVVMGHIYCADTGAPARMASVMLELASDVENSQPGARETKPIHMASVRTSLDGSFSMQHVAPGNYLVIVTLPGYISPFSALQASLQEIRNPDATLKQQFLKYAPRVTVQPNAPASIEIRLERGATIGGVVRFDDGGPAIGMTVRPLLHRDSAWIPITLNGFAFNADITTNDRGEFRFSGLPSGEYLIQADLELVNSMYEVSRDEGGSGAEVKQYSISLFSGAVTQAKNAKPLTIKVGDDREGEDFNLPLGKLHRLRGALVAERDGHALNAGEVELLNADDLTLVASTKVKPEDSLFTFAFVPEGSYVLSVSGVADANYTEIMLGAGSMPPTSVKTTVVHAYAKAKQAVQVDGDIDNVSIAVAEALKGAP
jgi:hypothetical protein